MTDQPDPVEKLARLFHGPWYDSAPDQHKEVSRRNARAFISALVAEAVAQEREACAKVADDQSSHWANGAHESAGYGTRCEVMGMSNGATIIAAAIRARTP